MSQILAIRPGPEAEAVRTGKPLAIRAGALAQRAGEAVKASSFLVEARGPAGTAQAGGVAVVPVFGVIGNGIMACCLGTPTDMLTRLLDALAAEPAVRAVVLDIDSPGGDVIGVSGAVAALRGLARVKPVVACATGAMTSLALWIGSQASWTVVSTTSPVGSIGTIELAQDVTKMLAEDGVRVVPIATQDHKADRQFGVPVTDQVVARTMTELKAYDAVFHADVATGRKRDAQAVAAWAAVPVFIGAQTVTVGLADQVGTLDDAVRKALELADAAGARKQNHVGATRGPAAGASAVPARAAARSATMTPEEMKNEDPAQYAQFEAYFKGKAAGQAVPPGEDDDENAAPSAIAAPVGQATAPTAAATGQPARRPKAAAFGQLDDAIPKDLEGRDAIIARAQRESMSVNQAMGLAVSHAQAMATAARTAAPPATTPRAPTPTQPVATAPGAGKFPTYEAAMQSILATRGTHPGVNANTVWGIAAREHPDLHAAWLKRTRDEARAKAESASFAVAGG